MSITELVRNYAISVNDTDMYITILRSGKTYYTNYDKGFYDLMKSGVFTGAQTNGKSKGDYLKFTCTNTRFAPYFHHIVFCYYYRGLRKDNYIEVLRQFSNELSTNDLTIDHLQDGIYNNRKWNLSLMPKTANSQKSHIDKRYKHIFDIVSAYDGEGYRVQFTYLNKGIRAVRYYCDTPNDLNALYRYLKAHKWELRKAKAGVQLSDSFYSSSGNFENYYSNTFPQLVPNEEIHGMQRHLVKMRKTAFSRYIG